MLLSAELYGQYVSVALRSEAVDTGNVTEITLVRQNIGAYFTIILIDLRTYYVVGIIICIYRPSVLAAIEVDPTSLGDIIFPKVVKVNEKSGSAQTVIPAALLAERGALGITLWW